MNSTKNVRTKSRYIYRTTNKVINNNKLS